MHPRTRALWMGLALCLAAPLAKAQGGAAEPPIEGDFALPALPDLPEPAQPQAQPQPQPQPAPADADAPVPATAVPPPPARAPEFEALEVSKPTAAPDPVKVEAPAVKAPEAVWSESDKYWFAATHQRSAPGAGGETGLRRALSALPGTVGNLRFSLSGDFARATDFLAPGDVSTRFTGTLAAAYVPDPLPFVEFFALYRNASTTNTKNDPSLVLTLGDLQLGAKAGWTLPILGESLALGVDAAVNPTSGVGDVGLDGGATNLEARFLATWDARKLWYFVPIRLHLNAGYASPSGVAVDVDRRTTCAEEYALGSNRFHRGLAAFGVEVPLPHVTPFLEAASELPFGASLVDNDGCSFDAGFEPDPGRTIAYGDAMPLSFTLGARITALSQVTFDAGVELGASRYNLWGLRAVPPWTAFAAVSYAFDPIPEPVVREVVKEVVKETVRVEERVVEKKVEVPAPITTGRVNGTVLDAKTRTAVADVILWMEQLAPMATGAAGTFASAELPPGKYRLNAKRQGYEPGAIEVEVRAGEAVQADLLLVRRPEPASLAVRVKGPNGKPAAGAKVTLATSPAVEAVTDATGLAKFEKLAAGTVRAVVVANGALARGAAIELAEGKTADTELALAALPKKPLVKAGPETLVLTRKIAFTGEAELTKADLEVVDAVADALLRSGGRVRIEANVDLGPVEERNAEVAGLRGAAVKARLVAQGVAAESIEVAALGSSKPLVPRTKPKSREKNERIDFRLIP